MIHRQVRTFLLLLLCAVAFLPSRADSSEFSLSIYANLLAGQSSLIAEEPEVTEAVYGFDEELTFLGSAALQAQWRKGRSTLVGRVEWEDTGISPFEDPGFNLRVAFYNFRAHPAVDFKIGRIEVPLGLFNQYRRLGTLHPFSRVAPDFYREGGPSTQSVDGLGVSLRRPGLSLDMFWGEYEFQEGLFETFEFTARDVWGAEFRATPQLGQVELTAGAGYIHYRTAGDQSFPETPSRRQGYWGFLEANYRSMFFRVEGRAYEGRSQPTLPPFGALASSTRFLPVYAEWGWRHGPYMAGLRVERTVAESNLEGGLFLSLEVRQRRSFTLSAAREIGPHWVAKLEATSHTYGFPLDPEVVDGGPPLRLRASTEEFDGSSVVFTLSYAGTWQLKRRGAK